MDCGKKITGTIRGTWTSLAVVSALVIGVYAYMAQSGGWELWSQDGADSDYNLLVQGFQAHQLNLKKEVPPGFASLADPFDPAANLPYRGASYRMNDLSYYNGRFYLYFGVTPALILFWPYAAVTGHYLLHRQAVLIFCTVGFLATVGLLRALWQRYFPEVSVGVAAACALALGLATCVPEQLSQADFYEVATSCGYMLTMLALGAIWCALHEPEREKCRWLATASVAYGLAVGARPSLLFGAVGLLGPVVQAWRGQRHRVGALLLAATVPIALIGLGLMVYNARRFGSPFEFGMRYQVNWFRPGTRQMFSLRYLWLNFRVYFLEPVRWSAPFPFVHEIAITRVPPGHAPTGRAFGVLTNVPLVWLALAVPLAWRNQSEPAAWTLRWFVTAVGLLFGTGALTLGLLATASFRYEVDFLPTLVLLAVIGIFGLERALANRPVQRRTARWGWGLLLGFSVVFNLLATVEHYAEVHTIRGLDLGAAGQMREAIIQFEQAMRIEPYFAPAHYNLGIALQQTGKLPEAIEQYEQALRIKPDDADAHNNLGDALYHMGRDQEAIKEFEAALQIEPDYAEAHYSLGSVLLRTGNVRNAMAQFEQALHIKPDFAEAHYNLGLALARTGKIEEAIPQYEQALHIKPDFAEAHYSLGFALSGAGKFAEGIAQYEQAVRIKPDFAEAHCSLGIVLLGTGKPQDAIRHLEQAVRIKPDFAEAHYSLGVALSQTGKLSEAIEQYEQAVRIKPDFAEAHCSLGEALEKAGRVSDAIQHYGQALRLRPDLTAAGSALTRLQGIQ